MGAAGRVVRALAAGKVKRPTEHWIKRSYHLDALYVLVRIAIVPGQLLPGHLRGMHVVQRPMQVLA